jgi:predicted DsbA family dithiol-disulfide isomerase
MFFVNGRPIAGASSLRVFTDVVEQELKRAGKRDYDALVAEGKPSADSPDATRPAFELDSASVYRMGLGLPGHHKGADDAPVTIVEWSDFQCPYCARQAPVLAHVTQKYGKDVRLVYRHLAMAMHRNASLAAEASIAAAQQGKFWEFHDQVFAHPGAVARADLDRYAEAIGLDLVAFRAALDERRYRDLVVAEASEASALGIDGTPTLFINGSPVTGAQSADKLDALIDAQLDRARRTIASGLAARDYYAVVMSGAVGDERSDPSTVPSVRNVELRDDDRARAVAAACRRRDGTRAVQLAATLTAEPRHRAMLVCSGLGIDLPTSVDK